MMTKPIYVTLPNDPRNEVYVWVPIDEFPDARHVMNKGLELEMRLTAMRASAIPIEEAAARYFKQKEQNG
jgi:hypothetical protein